MAPPRLLVRLVLCAGLAIASASYDDLISPFPLDEISLAAGSLYDKALSLNRDYILLLDPDQLLHTFRLNAGLPTSSVPFTSSWEDPSCEVRGQFMGHYLSALAMLGKHTGVQLLSPSSGCGLETKPLPCLQHFIRRLPIGRWWSTLILCAGDSRLTTRLDYLIDELRIVQDSLHSYLSAFPFEHFVRLQSLAPVWAPFYVVRAPHAQAVLESRVVSS